MELDQPIILTNATLATLAGPTGYGLIENGAVVVDGQTIAFVGQSDAIPGEFATLPRLDLDGRLVTPGLIDCHTHIVHGGHRAREFEMRLDGATYEEVARAGGGIVSSVRSTREASESDLVASALPRLDALISEGMTTIEIKSGYGLEIETELKMLRAARRLGQERKVRVRTTYLGAHAVPAEYKGRTEAYLIEVCLPGLEAAAAEGLVDAVDGFCEGIAFSVEDMTRVFDAAKRLGLPVKLHAEQLSRIGGTQLAARYGALSADHVEYATDADAAALAASGTVAVLLPGAFYAIRETQVPPVAAFRAHEVPMALATDCNPGTSPLTSLLLTMNMGCTFFRLTVEEALRGVTVNAAKALGLDDCGRISEGLRADLAIWNVETPAELVYRFGFNPLHARVFGGSQ
ncbi:imidazolonepropionase [Pannonibacter sp. SL95]|uniref:imidazolonepropionase n=1 Tax=Pannonibacter sp. SL95 TaxID=2995153 RepID=UPI002274E1A0|nr:imidazolonepropionase [Pannonibacter sp. SL95]MCY1706228.1 imidazolonepropionase [Pannonibacter sp. SL95]